MAHSSVDGQEFRKRSGDAASSQSDSSDITILPLATFALSLEAIPSQLSSNTSSHSTTNPSSLYQVVMLDEVGRPSDQTHTFSLDLADARVQQELLSARELAEGRAEHVRTQVSREHDVHSLARRLAEFLFGNPSIQAAWQRHCTLARAVGAISRLVLSFSTRPIERSAQSLLVLPWELVADPELLPEKVNFLCTREDISLVREIADPPPQQIRGTSSKHPLRILVLISDPRDLPSEQQLDSDQEHDAIMSALDPLITAGLARKPVFEDAVSLATLRRHLREEHRYDLLYYVGHGDWDDESQEGQLVMEQDPVNVHAGSTRRLAAHELLAMLTEPSIVRKLPYAVVLGGCLTAKEYVTGDHFGSVAMAFLRAGVPSVVALQNSVLDEAGLVLTDVLFSTLAHVPGTTLEYALNRARHALVTRTHSDQMSEVARAMRTRLTTERATSQESSLPSRVLEWENDEDLASFWQRLEPASDILSWASPTLYQRGGLPRPILAPYVISSHVPKAGRNLVSSKAVIKSLNGLEYLARGYVGHHHIRRIIREALADPESPIRTVLIYGLGGIGKTVLATQVVQRLLEEKTFEGVIVVSVHDKMGAYQVLNIANRYLMGLGERRFRRPLDQPTTPVTEKVAGLVKILAERPRGSLILLDNCEDWIGEDHRTPRDSEVAELFAALFDNLARSGSNSRLLITSRYNFDVLPTSMPPSSTAATKPLILRLPLDGLPLIEAVRLLGILSR